MENDTLTTEQPKVSVAQLAIMAGASLALVYLYKRYLDWLRVKVDEALFPPPPAPPLSSYGNGGFPADAGRLRSVPDPESRRPTDEGRPA
jgi:hypothetical protein